MRAAGIDRGSFHTLRHTAASLMVQARVPLFEVQTILGHSTPLMTMRYAHLQSDHLMGAMAKLDAALDGDSVMTKAMTSSEMKDAAPTPAAV